MSVLRHLIFMERYGSPGVVCYINLGHRNIWVIRLDGLHPHWLLLTQFEHEDEPAAAAPEPPSMSPTSTPAGCTSVAAA